METAVVGIGTLIAEVAFEGLKKKNFVLKISPFIDDLNFKPLTGSISINALDNKLVVVVSLINSSAERTQLAYAKILPVLAGKRLNLVKVLPSAS